MKKVNQYGLNAEQLTEFAAAARKAVGGRTCVIIVDNTTKDGGHTIEMAFSDRDEESSEINAILANVAAALSHAHQNFITKVSRGVLEVVLRKRKDKTELTIPKMKSMREEEVA